MHPPSAHTDVIAADVLRQLEHSQVGVLARHASMRPMDGGHLHNCHRPLLKPFQVPMPGNQQLSCLC
jgi:hypothetical protein